MKTQKLILTTFVILLTALAVIFFKEFSPDSGGGKNWGGETLLNEKTGVEEIRKIVLAGKTERVTLENSGDGLWVVAELESYPAEASKIFDFLEDLKSAKVHPFADKGESLFDELGLNPDNPDWGGRTLAVFDESGPILEVVLGDDHEGAAAASGQGLYFRSKDSAGVFLLQNGLGESPKPVSWARLKLFSFKAGDLASIAVEGPYSFTLTRGEGVETFNADGKETDPAAVNKITDSFGPFEASDLVPAAEVDASSLPKASLVALSPESGDLTLRFFELGEAAKEKHGVDYLVKIDAASNTDSDLKSMRPFYDAFYFGYPKWRYLNIFAVEEKLLKK